MLHLAVLVCFSAISSSLALPFAPAVINGQDAAQGQFPWQVAVVTVLNSLESQLCTGTIISEEWVLTAAHCVNGAFAIGVYSGNVDLSSEDIVLTSASDYIVHEDFDSSMLRNDVGLIHLDTPLVFDDNTKAIALSEDDILPGTNVTVSGWGHSLHDDDTVNNITSILQYAFVTTLDNIDCENIYGSNIIFPNVVCAVGADPIKNPCFGDGGAPLVANVDTNPVHVGIFSFISSVGCEQNFPAGYTRTQSFRGWIQTYSGV